jgi:hypothetical protein
MLSDPNDRVHLVLVEDDLHCVLKPTAATSWRLASSEVSPVRAESTRQVARASS